MKTKQWDLTKSEITDLAVRRELRMGRFKLLEALQRQFGIEAEAENGWWEALSLSHKIPKEYRHRLLTDHRIGKVWVSGEVDNLDNLPDQCQDNPY